MVRQFLAAVLLCCSVPALAEEKFRLGVIGLTHSHAWGHLRAAAQAPDVELVGVADPHEDLWEEARRVSKLQLKFYSDYRKLLEEARPQAVLSFVENNRHLEIVQACAPRKVHVMFEKPMASTLADARRMEQLARQHGIRLMINYPVAWRPETQAAYEQVQKGVAGKVWRARFLGGHGGPGGSGPEAGPNRYFHAWLDDPVKNGGGALIDFGCYGASYLRWYLGKPASVFAVVNRLKPEKYNTYDNAVLVLSYPNGVGIIEGSWDLPRSFSDLEVFGDKGSVHLAQKLEVYKGREREEVQAPPLPEDQRSAVVYFISRIRSGGPLHPLVSPEFGVDVMEILEAARQSIATGRAIRLPLPAK